MEYGKPFGISRWLSRAPEHTRKLWKEAQIEPRAIDREVSCSMHMTHIGSLPEALVRQALRAGMADGWGGSMCGTEFSDVMFGTPIPVDTEANLGELKTALGVVKTLMTREKRLNDAFMSGVATALCAEFIEVLKYMDGATPYEEPLYGHLADATIRELGVPLVTGDIPGVAVILGSAPTKEDAVALVKSYQAQGILVTLVGGVIDQCIEAGLNMGYAVRIVPLGKDVTSVIHVVSVALRAALIFGNVTPGDAANLMKYTFERVPAFVNAFKPLDDVIVACGAGAIALGFPVVTNETENIFHVPKSLIVQEDVDKFHATSLEARDIKIKNI